MSCRSRTGVFQSILAAFLVTCATALVPTRGDTPSTTPAGQTGPLKISVSAVQGGAQYRSDSASKWQPVTVGLDLPEGVEFRTGPRGAVQFTIGTDQVFRVDRLSVVRVMRANLGDDGTIRTDVGMTYGRVSKDVDLPERPHQDTIVTPTSTLAVRGTHVALYDQPPFEPEAVSLTGLAFYKNGKGHNVSLGGVNQGTVQITGDQNSGTDFLLGLIPNNPLGAFSGTTLTELTGINQGGLNGTTPSNNGGNGLQKVVTAAPSNLTFTPGGFTINISFEFGTVTLSVNGPMGATSVTHTAGGNGGTDRITFGNAHGGQFANGTYTFSATFSGGEGSTSVFPTVAQANPAPQIGQAISGQTTFISSEPGNQSATYSVQAPIGQQRSIMLISGASGSSEPQLATRKRGQ